MRCEHGCAPVDERQRADVAGQLQCAGADEEQGGLAILGAWALQERRALLDVDGSKRMRPKQQHNKSRHDAII